jgi:dipeptidyl-peptidase-3
MKRFKPLIMAVLITSSLTGCTKSSKPDQDFEFLIERFADLKIMRYQVPGFENLSLEQKKLVYYLSQAALSGRDIIYDQNGKYNLAIRRTLEGIYESYKGDRETGDFRNFEVYLKRIWFSNGIYHHYSTDKFDPGFSKDYFMELVAGSDTTSFPLNEGETVEEMLSVLIPVMFDPKVLPKKVSTDTQIDIVANSAVNFYENVTEEEAVNFYENLKDPADTTPVSYGLTHDW